MKTKNLCCFQSHTHKKTIIGKIVKDILCKYKNFFEKLGKQQKGLLEVFE